ncbi:hypothetical protein JCM8547_002467 [Rhodosporidiobolus lusitaniae]
MLYQVFTTIFTALAVTYLLQAARVLWSCRGQPGFISLFAPFWVWPTLVLAQNRPRVFLSRKGVWELKADLFARYGSTVLVVPSLVPPKVSVFIGDGKLIHQINSDRKTFTKPEGANSRVTWYWGHNLLTSDGENWRRHRRIAVSSFSEKNVAQTWEQAVRLVSEWHERVEEGRRKGKKEVKGVENVMAALTLLVMGEAAFGLTFPWPSSFTSTSFSSAAIATTEKPAFVQVAKTVLQEGLLPSLLPEWAMRLPFKKLQRIQSAYDEFEKQLKQVIQDRRDEIVSGVADDKHDLLSALVRANLLEEGRNKLSDQELLSDAYIFVLAGHETSSNALTAIFLFLALYPEHQSVIFDEVSDYTSSSRPFVYPEAFNGLPYTFATIQEGLRLAGPVSTTFKRAEKSTTLVGKTVGAKREKIEDLPVKIPEGAEMKESVVGAHYNPKSWNDPYDFRPARFIEDKVDSENIVAFSSGLRGCIGKQFALAEMVVIVSLTLLKYRIEIPDSHKADWALRKGEKERERRDRVLNKGTWPITMSPSGIDLAFVPREEGKKEV